MTVRDLNWKIEATFERKHVVAMGKIAEYSANIESMLKRDFPSSMDNMNWDGFRSIMAIFRQLSEQDKTAYTNLCQVVQACNTGKIDHFNPIIIPTEKKES